MMKNDTTISICGSMKFAKEMEMWRKKLQDKNFQVFAPHGTEDLSGYKEAGSTNEAVKRKIENDYINAHYKLIKQSQGILILNYDKNGISNYIGGNSLMEMGFAFTQNRDIFLLNPIPDLSYKTEVEAMKPIIINGDVDKISEYYDNLPNVFISSESVLKRNATSLALRESNFKYNVFGTKTVSGVSEEPYSIDEAYEGAENRLKDLKNQVKNKKWELLISIESGNVVIHKKHNTWGFSICIIENKNGKRAITIDTDLEIPKEMTDLVPSKYADLGLLAQEKYGTANKDPYIPITNGKLTRYNLLFNSVVNTLACL